MKLTNKRSIEFKTDIEKISEIDFSDIYSGQRAASLSKIFKTIQEDLILLNINGKINFDIIFYEDKISIGMDKFYSNYRKASNFVEFYILFEWIDKDLSQKEINLIISNIIDTLAKDEDIRLITPMNIESFYNKKSQIKYISELFEFPYLIEEFNKSSFYNTPTTGSGNKLTIAPFKFSYHPDGDFRINLTSYYFEIYLSINTIEISFSNSKRSITIKNFDDIEKTREILILILNLNEKTQTSSLKEILKLDSILSI